MACVVVQGCGKSEPKAIAEAEPAVASAAFFKGDSVAAGGETVVARGSRAAEVGAPIPADSFAQRFSMDSFTDRFSAASSYPQSVRSTVAEHTGTVAPGSFKVAALSAEVPYPLPTVKQARTGLIGFDNSVFPKSGGRYSDNRVLVHVPAGFDVRKPGVILVFFHGHRATLERDVRDRQLLPAQVSESGVNAVLVAPQLAYDAADSSAGRLAEPNGFKRLMAEAAEHLARVHGDPRTKEAFARMPVVIVAYSGGFLSAASSLNVGGLGKRVIGVVLMDAIYGEMDKFTSWIARNRSGFFISAYTQHNKARDDHLAKMLTDRGIPVQYELNGPLKPGTVALLSMRGGVNHRDFVTQSWTEHPVADILLRMAKR
jgi:hypothetical protein